LFPIARVTNTIWCALLDYFDVLITNTEITKKFPLCYYIDINIEILNCIKQVCLLKEFRKIVWFLA
jgi:hypothetical protein